MCDEALDTSSKWYTYSEQSDMENTATQESYK